MYNFNEVKNLNELKELCFYIKAINEAQVDVNNYSNMGQVKDHLKNKYNLEISFSKLYLFVKKIELVVNRDKFPHTEEVDNIINEYVAKIHKDINDAEKEVRLSEMNVQEPKHKVGKSSFSSSETLSQNIVVNKKVYKKENMALLIWAYVVGLFITSVTFCTIGLVVPSFFNIYETTVQEICLALLEILLVGYIMYLILYAVNHKRMNELKFAIENYYKYENVIKYDINRLNVAKQALYTLKNQFSINGIDITDEQMKGFLKNADEVDIKHYNERINAKPIGRELGLGTSKPVKFSQVLSRYEQNQKWKESKAAKLEKQNINQELVVRIDFLAKFLNKKGLDDIELAKAMSDLYCKELSLAEREEKIDKADSKINLAKNYVALVDKLLQFEKLNLFANSGKNNMPKQALQVTTEERADFWSCLNVMFERIDKAVALGLLSEGQSNSFKNLRQEVISGVVQGSQIDAVLYRYDLAKLFIRLYDEISTYDILN